MDPKDNTPGMLILQHASRVSNLAAAVVGSALLHKCLLEANAAVEYCKRVNLIVTDLCDELQAIPGIHPGAYSLANKSKRDMSETMQRALNLVELLREQKGPE